MHRIPFGEQTNLSDLVNSLKEDRHFAMDFWAMVGDLSASERGSLSDEEMLEVIVEGSSSAAVATLPASEKTAVDNLKNLLAGVDVGAPVLPDPIAEPEDDLLTGAQHRRTETSNAPKDEGALPKEGQSGDINGSTAQRSIAEALLRLEQTSRELKDRLFAIEQMKLAELSGDTPKPTGPEQPVATVKEAHVPPKISRREVSLETEAPKTKLAAGTETLAAAPLNAQTNPATVRIFEVEEPVPVTKSQPAKERQIFAPRPASSLSRRGLAPPADADDDPSIAVPLSAYAEANRRTMTARIAAVVILLALAGGAWFMVSRGYGQLLVDRYSPIVRHKLTLFSQEIHDLVAGSPKPEPAKKPEPAQAQQAPEQPQAPGLSTAPSASPPAGSAPESSANPTTNSTANPSTETLAKTPQTAVPQPVRKEPVRPSPPSIAASQAPVVRAQPAPPEMTDAIRVPSATMEENLVASRVPIYPDNAREMRIEGPVMVETMITKSGTVAYARAISGDPSLRAAAEAAVSKWRYKPYTHNGRTVDVVTQVRLVFRLSRR
jgi:TonB family protein